MIKTSTNFYEGEEKNDRQRKNVKSNEIANYMGVTKKTVLTWVNSNQLTVFKLDKTFSYPRRI